MKKLTSIDYLRAFSMLYIVSYWHALGYAGVSFGQNNDVMWAVTGAIMALFVFISGFLVGGEKSRRTGAKQFYLRRFFRIYPLYLLAVALFYVAGVNGGWTLLKSAVGVSMFMEPPPLTLWFITMLLLFYLITPLLLALVDKPLSFFSAVGALLFAILVFEVTVGTADLRLALYLPSYCLGIYCANRGFRNALVNERVAILVLPVAAVLPFLRVPLQTLDALKILPLITVAAYLVFLTCYRNEGFFKPNRVIAFLSYSSFAMYLFHRPVYSAMTNIYMPSSTAWQVVYITTVCVLVIAMVSFALQRLYDWSYRSMQVRLDTPQKMAT